jgi:hypothetical protein
LAAGQDPDVDLVRGVHVRFHRGERAGLRRVGEDVFEFGGSPEQWEARAGLLDPLTESGQGFQYLDYDGVGDVGVVVTTYPDGSF